MVFLTEECSPARRKVLDDHLERVLLGQLVDVVIINHVVGGCVADPLLLLLGMKQVQLHMLDLVAQLGSLVHLNRFLLYNLLISMASFVIIRGSWSLGATSLVGKVGRLVLIHKIGFDCGCLHAVLPSLNAFGCDFLRIKQVFIFICILLLEILLV